MFRCFVRLALATALLMLALAAVAQAQVQPYGYGDYGGFHDILPPGTNGLDTLPQLAAFEATGQRPEHNDDQLAMYNALTTAAGNITDATLSKYYTDSTFGVPAADVES